MKNEIDYWDGIKIKNKKEGWSDKCQCCDNVVGLIGLRWRVVCDIKEDHMIPLEGIRGKGKVLNFSIYEQTEGDILPKVKEVEASIGVRQFIFFVCIKSCAQKLREALDEDRRFTDLAENMRIVSVEKKPVRSEFECELCGKRFWVKWQDDIPKKGDIVRLTCPNCRNKGVKFIRTYEEYEH
ncbi:MAG: hypothetical protein ACETWC_01015 [Acidobacteriota bacterium]